MKLARFHAGRSTRIGRVEDDEIIDLSIVDGVGPSMRQLLTDLDALRPAIERAAGARHALADVVLAAPVHDPQKYLGIGMNYRAHAEEARQAGIPIPASQMWFNKQVSCITGPYDPIELPEVSNELDYEAELGVVIGRRCRHVDAGDTHGPIGLWLTTDDEVRDPLDLEMCLSVNGEKRQHAWTNDMIYDIYEQIAYLSTVMTLYPGDILATGTPSGIGAPTGRFLTTGDVVRTQIEGLGAIKNRVEPEGAAAARREEART